MADSTSRLQFVIDAVNKTDAAFKSVEAGVDKMSAALEKHKKLIMGVEIAAGVALGALVLFGKSAADKYAQAELTLAQLKATLESTGGAAGVTAQKAQELAESLVKVSTYSKDNILSAEQMLLTFTNIKDNVFPQTTEAVMNMATAMKTDLRTAAEQVGKAMNDPTQALTMLTRAGVQFTDGEKDVITKAAEAGDVLTAQGLILDKLTEKFGGSASAAAETYAGKLEQAKNRMDELQESVGKGLLPVMSNLYTALMNSVEGFTGSANASVATFTAFRWVAEFAAAAGVQVTKVVAALGALNNVRAHGLMAPFSDKESKLFEEGQVFWGDMANEADNFLQNFVDMNERARADVEGLAAGLDKVGDDGGTGYTKLGDAAAKAAAEMEKAQKKIEETTKKIGDMDKKIGDTRAKISEAESAAAREQMDARRGMGEAIVAQEQKVADLRAQLGQETDIGKRFDLNDQIIKEQAAIDKKKWMEGDLATEIGQAKERAAMTDFERTMDDLQKKQIAQENAGRIKIEGLNKELSDELEARRKLAADIGAIEDGITAKTAVEVAKREEAAIKSIKRVEEAKTQMETGTGPGYSSGGGAAGGGGGSWGEAVTVPPPTASPASILNFIFNGDVVDRDKLIKDVTGALDRKAALANMG